MKAIIAVLLLMGVAQAQSPGTFTATGSLTTSRYFHTATLLLDGRVLIAGGQNDASTGPLSSTEIYDPAAKTFAPGPNMTVGRSGHTATMLPDGRILIAGGDWSGTAAQRVPAGTAEIYDPSNGTFTATGSLLIARSGSNATLLPNGKVLVTGGFAGETTTAYYIGDAELYDPATGLFSAAGAYAGPLAGLESTAFGFGSTSTLLADGTVLFATMPEAQVYSPMSLSFSLTGAPSVESQLFGRAFQTDYIAGQSATLLLNGKVLAAGGEQEDTGRFASAQLYDPATGAFVFTGSMSAARNNHTATLLPDGTVLVTGDESQTCSDGGCWFSGTIAGVEFYDPAQGVFASAGNMTVSRAGHTATLLADGDLLLAGGYAYGGIGLYGGASALAELYHPASPSPAPVLYSMSGDGKGPGAIWHATTGQLVSSQSPAMAGELVSMYAGGLVSGGLIPPQIAVGGKAAAIQFFGDAPGYPGYSQVNFRLPSGVAGGTTVPVNLMYLGRASNQVTLALQ